MVKRFFLFLAALCLMSLCACGDDAPQESPAGAATLDMPEPVIIISTPDSTPEPTPATLSETEDMGQEYIGRITFLGDSTTYGLKYYGVLAGGKDTTQVWTPASGTLAVFSQSIATIVYPDTGTEITIREAAALNQPELMVITLGVNGVSSMDEEYFKSEYTDLIEGILEASPETVIILQSILPVAAHYENQTSINNEKISRANIWIEEIARAAGLGYLDTYSALVGEDGFLPNEYQNGDGLHLNEAGFNLILEYIRTHGVNLM